MAGVLTLKLGDGGVDGSVVVYVHNTSTKATLYTDHTASSTASSAGAATTDGDGVLTTYAAAGLYDVQYTVINSNGGGEPSEKIAVAVQESPFFSNVVQALAPAAAALTVDVSLGSILVISPTANVTSTTLDNLQTGQRVNINFISDGTHTYVYPTICKFAGGAQGSSTSTSGYRDSYEFLYDGTHLNEIARSLAIH